MLVLTRTEAQSIAIGPDVTVTILAVHGKQVKVGVIAPRNVPVTRSGRRDHDQREKAQP